MANDWKAWCGNRTVVRESSIGELYICAVKLDIQNFEQTQLFYSASYFNLGEGIGALFRRDWANQNPPWRRRCVANLQLAFSCNWLWKVLRLRDMSRHVKLSFSKHDRPKVAQHIQVVSILLREAKLLLGLFCFHLNTIGWSGNVASRPTIHRDNRLGFKGLRLRVMV